MRLWKRCICFRGCEGVRKTNKERDFLAGYGEVVKYGLLGDYDFYCWLEKNFTKIKERDTQTLIKAVAHSCEMKAEIVINDEKDSINGIRETKV